MPDLGSWNQALSWVVFGLAIVINFAPDNNNLLNKVGIGKHKVLILASLLVLYLLIISGSVWFEIFRLLLGITIAIVIHELGHFLTAKAIKAKVEGFIITPFLGAVKLPKDTPTSKLFWITLFGPATSIVFLLVYNFVTVPSAILKIACVTGLFVNALNVLPIFFVDGGNLIKMLLERYLNDELLILAMLATTIVTVVILYLFGIDVLWILIPIGLLIASAMIDVYRNKDKGETKTAKESPVKPRWKSGLENWIAYFGLQSVVWFGFFSVGGINAFDQALATLKTLPW